MLDNSIRVAWLDEVYKQVRSRMGWENILPENVCATVGFPPTRARGKKKERASGWMSPWGHHTWQGSEEKSFVTVHPERMKTGEMAVGAMIEAMYKAVYGPRSWRRRGRLVIAECDVAGLLDTIGQPPPGYADIPEPTKKQGTRLRKYACEDGTHIIRAATDTLDATCDTCKTKFKLQ